MKKEFLNKYFPLISRILISAIFIISGIGKITNFQATLGFMNSVGFPITIVFLILAIIFELVGGISILIGYYSKIGSISLIIFTILATLIFHINFADQNQIIMLLKNLAIIGGLLLIVVNGSGPFSVNKK